MISETTYFTLFSLLTCHVGYNYLHVPGVFSFIESSFLFLLHHPLSSSHFLTPAFFVFPHSTSALYVVDLKKFRRIAAGDRLRGQYQALSQDPNSLSNLDQVCNSEMTSSHYTFGDLSCYFIFFFFFPHFFIQFFADITEKYNSIALCPSVRLRITENPNMNPTIPPDNPYQI